MTAKIYQFPCTNKQDSDTPATETESYDIRKDKALMNQISAHLDAKERLEKFIFQFLEKDPYYNDKEPLEFIRSVVSVLGHQ